MKFALLTIFISFSSMAVEVEGHLRQTKSGWMIVPLDKSAITNPGPLCSHSALKDNKDIFVKAKINETRKDGCFEIDEIGPTVLDPLRGSHRSLRKTQLVK